MSGDAAPYLGCPECGEPVLQATNRGRYNADGEYVAHRDGCRCAWCDWMWFDDVEPERCVCGTLVGVSVDDSHAYPKPVEEDSDA